MTRTIHISYIWASLALLASAACVDDSSAMQAGERRTQRRQTGRAAQPSRPQTRQQRQRTPAARSPADTGRSAQSAGLRPPADSVRFVEHSAYIRAGLGGTNAGALRLVSPFALDSQVVRVGSQLYLSYNCVDCHGMDGSGAMGPSLADGRWRYGGTPAEVFESIYQGRPEGMPAWGRRISDADVWRLVAYVRSLEVGKNVTTENFTGKAQQRMGH
jgi:mono/diheme cytochrome c family protein